MMFAERLCTVPLLAMVLLGCSTSDPASPNRSSDANTIIKTFGYIGVNVDTRPRFDRDYTETDIDAVFTKILSGFDSTVDELTVGEFAEEFDSSNKLVAAQLYGDTLGCIDRDTIEPLAIPEASLESIGPFPFQTISAGEVLTITSPTGSWPELARNNEEGSIRYYHPGPVEGYPAADTTVDIPGDEFPPFANLSIPVIQPLLNMRAEFTDTTNGRLFTAMWEPGNDASKEVGLRILRYDKAESRFVGVRCLVLDTGIFSVPAELNYLFTEPNPQSYRVFMNRFRSSYVRQGDAVVVFYLNASGEN